MGFSSASLAISEHCGIVALKDTVNRGFCSIFIDEFLCWVLIIDIIKAVALPDTQMWILFDVTAALPLVDFLPKVLHNSDRATIRGNLNDRYEVSIWPLSRQGRSDSDHYFEIAATCSCSKAACMLHGLSISWLWWWLEVLTWAAHGRGRFRNGANAACLHHLLLDSASLHGTALQSVLLLWILVFRNFPSFLEHLVDELLLCVCVLLWS